MDWRRQASIWLILAGIAALVGCTDSALRRPPLSAPISISDIKSVAGKWEGVSKIVPAMRDDAEVILIIDANGTFEFVGNRGSDVMVGAGTLILRNGKLMARTVRLDGTFTLYEDRGKSILVVDAISKDGNRYNVELSRIK